MKFISLLSREGSHPEEDDKQDAHKDDEPVPCDKLNDVFHDEAVEPAAMERRVSGYFSSVASFFLWLIHVITMGTAVTRIMAAMMTSR